MPGILGFYCKEKRNREENAQILNKMIRAMKHEDNYIIDSYIDSNASIGRISLGVINSGPQPEWSVDKRYCLFLDGEIFDSESSGLLVSDDMPEERIVLDLFIQYGPDMVQMINGIFVAVVYDSIQNELFLFTDRYGYRYLYYYHDHNYFIFASEIKAILATDRVKKAIDDAAISDMHYFHFIIGERTFFRDIKLLPVASTVKIVEGRPGIHQYWNYPSSIEYFNSAIHDYVDEATRLIKKSVSRHFKKGHRIGVTLSGGLDSRIISFYASEKEKSTPCFHSGHEGISETKIAKNVSDTLDMPWFLHNALEVKFPSDFVLGSRLSDGHISCEQFYFIGLARRIRHEYDQAVNYILDGIGLDVLFNPAFLLPPMKLFPIEKQIDAVWGKYSFLFKELVIAAFSPDFSKALYEYSRENVKSFLERFNSENMTELMQYFYFSNRGRRFVLGTPNTHRAYLEQGYPGMDYDLFDFGVRLPYYLRYKAELYRKIFLRHMAPLADIPWAQTGLTLERYENFRSKMRKKVTKYSYYLSRITNGRWEFLPKHQLDRRFRKDKTFRKYVIEFLSDKKTLDRGYFAKSNVENLIRLQDSGRNYFDLFISLITVEMFYRNFVD